MAKIHVLENEISFYSRNDEDYICITGIARYKDPGRTDYLIQNWLRNRNTLEFLRIWDRLNNPDFYPIEFDGFRNLAGHEQFYLNPQIVALRRPLPLVSFQNQDGMEVRTPIRISRFAEPFQIWNMSGPNRRSACLRCGSVRRGRSLVGQKSRHGMDNYDTDGKGQRNRKMLTEMI